MMTQQNKTHAFITFILGLLVGNKVLPLITHAIYLAIILILMSLLAK